MLETKRSSIMKKMRFIPLLALVTVLSSCNGLGGNAAKAPTFAKEGEEVTFSEFKQQLNVATNDSEISDTNSKLTDRLIKTSSSNTTTRIWNRGKTDLEKNESQTTSKGEASFDTNNLVAKMTAESKGTQKVSDQESTYSETSSSKQDQFDKIKNVKYLIYANAKTKQYVAQTAVTGTTKDDALFDNLIRDSLSSLLYLFNMYLPSSTTEARDYLFHINNDTLFTFALTNEEEDSRSSGLYTLKTRTKIKVQLDLTDKKQAFRYSSESRVEYDYKKAYESYKADDVLTEDTKVYAEYTVSSKDVKVNPVDLSDYVQSNY